MPCDTVIATARLKLRRWRADDEPAFAAMNADPEVMRHFPATLTRAESDALVGRIRLHHERHGFGLWALEIPNQLSFGGFVGLSIPSFEAHFTPCVEIGWRLAGAAWGKGYATEAAHAALRYGFETAKLHEVVSFTLPANERSWRVMQRIGMHSDPADDFDHPRLPEGHPIRRHLLYRITSEEWRRQSS